MENSHDVFHDNSHVQVNNDYVVMILIIVYQENKMDLMVYKNQNYLIELLLESWSVVVLLLERDWIFLEDR